MLHQIETRILAALDKRMSASELASKTGLPTDSVNSFSQSLKEKGYVVISFEEEQKIALTDEGEGFMSEGLPEERVFRHAAESHALSALKADEKSIGLAWALKNRWVKIENGILKADAKMPHPYPAREALVKAGKGERLSPDELSLLSKRKLVSLSASKTIFIEPTAVKPKGGEKDAVNALTREMLLSGSWKESRFREYDVTAPAEVPFPAKRHMISRMKKRISVIFSEMGFEEMVGPELQSSFWNFDALFQPQDHPARDLADTFYVKGQSQLPDDSGMVERVKKIHEKYWGGEWVKENAQKPVLRTHTTCLSAKYLFEKCQEKKPRKFFSIGKVFRNEATDYKHLAEFFQVEGIVVWEGATFRNLLGCLKEFYKKLGFEKIRFQPSYFPYTEPSLEITVYFEKKKQWMELGGAGIFRPEVSIPLCDRYPVLAWGLSLERPLMLLNDMDDIRDFYKSSAGWLRKQKIQ